ncbi:hypothetical protein FEM48_Zijuj08G0046600 [Ziziphus jujuba var. spinosa]|uniref:Uncharacterized protein n=1 Tax=Ziziphus jujuba var. spinosa TaxID=714518 RepID=A0A978UX12_ZIZJJ|nr:hypothetical protein FEM48_Zijuj08G0046600 [Ziziphus jujuba var. spinosa]
MKKVITSKAIKNYKEEVLNPSKKDLRKDKLPRNVPNVSSALFFKHNTALAPPYRVLVDTNFINFSIQNKVSVSRGCHSLFLFCSGYYSFGSLYQNLKGEILFVDVKSVFSMAPYANSLFFLK